MRPPTAIDVFVDGPAASQGMLTRPQARGQNI